MKVYQAINLVQSELARTGIAKDRRNQQQGYQFRGIDDVYAALAPLLAKHGLCILPRVLARTCTERNTARGGALFYTTVEAEFDFVCAEDGSKHTVKTFGEAMDSGDKSTNKAMSAAYKYACLQAFSIPTEGDNDADATSHEPVARTAQAAPDMPTILQSLQGAPSLEILKGHFSAAWQMLDAANRPAAQAAYQARKAQLETAAGSLPPYPADQFAQNLPKWQAAIAAGKKSAGEVIAIVQSKYTLTAQQQEAIRQCARPAADPQPATEPAPADVEL